MVKTKIIATLGPSSGSEAVLRKMFISGLDVVRLNFSHGTWADHSAKIKLVRSLNTKLRRSIKIMQDLEGHRIRLGRLKEPFMAKKGAFLYLTQEPVPGDAKEVHFDYDGPLAAIKPASLIYIDDGKVLLKVVSRDKSRLKTKVVIGGMLSSRKGMNIIGAELSFEAITAKDKKDVMVAIKNGLEYVAQSFVGSARDIELLKDILVKHKSSAQIFAKVENARALHHIDEIIDEADGIIVARGDLGILLPIYKVPVFQKEIIKRCKHKGKPVVVATQMLDSMTLERLPTRAEVSDVANAILDGADYLLLSGETAIGKYPHLVVDMMNKIIKNRL